MSARQAVASAPRGSLRALAVALLTGLLALALMVGFASPGLAVEEEIPNPEEEEPPPDIDELCQEGTIAVEFCPERYEEPSWFQWMIYPLLIVGLVMVAMMVIAYLTWQPRFAREREEKRKSRR